MDEISEVRTGEESQIRRPPWFVSGLGVSLTKLRNVRGRPGYPEETREGRSQGPWGYSTEGPERTGLEEEVQEALR